MIRRKEIDVEVFEGGILSWDSGEMPYQNMCEALVAIDRPKLIPDPAGFKAGSFDSAVTSFAKRAVHCRGNMKVETHRLDRKVPTFLAQQVVRTTDDAIHTDIVTCELVPVKTDPPQEEVKITHHNPTLLPKLQANLATCESWILSKYNRKVSMVPAQRVTDILNKLLRLEGCMPMSRQGRLYAIPKVSTTDMLEQFASFIPDSSRIDIGISPIHLPPTASMFKKISRNCTAELERLLKVVESEVQTAGDKARKNGAKARYEKLEDVKRYVEAFKHVIGETKAKFFVDSAERIQKTITTNTVLDILS
tara:strand:+ start:243 stop:1163 length:921 start_codon:yes stop_codon:yes gene_type:complete